MWTGSASISAADPYSTSSQSGHHSGCAATQVSSPSPRTGTVPAGGRSASSSMPSASSIQAVPTLGWPAKGSSTSGV
ncbi:MAG TPA: hypothetical protein VFS73_09505 [Solirubrobacterales bacterium]|nr:hypothetical protein [Solirubrobacterales bacterium]